VVIHLEVDEGQNAENEHSPAGPHTKMQILNQKVLAQAKSCQSIFNLKQTFS